ncbi:MAG: carboxypeptidase regulatory-like domain-containing protein [Candidatus Staskawiczbacteria bacterium]|nr:carboxypeptidase regulatory-like domain-containing protein [Candidatus Staskawiczbacteria bacterium]
MEQAQKITEQVVQIQKQLTELIWPTEQKPATTEIVGVPRETPLAFQNLEELLPSEPINQFTIGPLPKGLQFFTNKFIGLKNTFKEVGISKISDITKLENQSINLPGLTESAGILKGELGINDLSFKAKQKIPSEIVFAKTGGGLIDFNINLSINNQGNPEQKIRTVSGKPLELVIKPDKPVKKIKGYLIFKRKNAELGFLQNLLGKSQASLIGSNIGQSQNNANSERKLVLQEFEYTDPDNDGIYTANIQTPAVDGEYEVITVMDYEDPKLALREFQLTVVVDPEGYIYEQLPSGQLRINNAKVSLYWLNPDSPTGEKNYELWPAKKYLQDNPYATDNTGKYSFLVPEGEYYLKVVANNYSDYQTEPFTVTKSDGIHMDIKMEKKSWWSILIDWFFKFKK